jgi:enoyl-CoA hydratase/carnithine racemase
MMDEVVQACRDIETVPDVRALIVTGGTEFFSAGADLTEALNVVTQEDSSRFFGSLHKMNLAVERLGKPVIAAIEGPCMTGAANLPWRAISALRGRGRPLRSRVLVSARSQGPAERSACRE